MGADLRVIGDKIREIAGTSIPVRIADAIVVSCDPLKRTCTVNSIDAKQKFQDGLVVRFMAEVSDGEYTRPEVGSTVTIIFRELTDPTIFSTSTLDQKTIIVGNQTYDIQNESQTLNSNEYGGLIKSIDPSDTTIGLLKKINNLENKLNSIIDALNAWIPVYSDGGLALRTLLEPIVGVIGVPPTPFELTLTQRNDIENANVSHGLKNNA